MNKTGQMIEFEEETGQTLEEAKERGKAFDFYLKYIQWLETELLKASVKAAAYDRLMSGGRKTLKEWANFLGRPVAIDAVGDGCFGMSGASDFTKDDYCWLVYKKSYIPYELIRYEGKWDKSLTYPDGWEKK